MKNRRSIFKLLAGAALAAAIEVTGLVPIREQRDMIFVEDELTLALSAEAERLSAAWSQLLRTKPSPWGSLLVGNPQTFLDSLGETTRWVG